MLEGRWAEEARLLGPANVAREADQRRRDNHDQVKRGGVTMIDLTVDRPVDRGSREARRQVALAQLYFAGTAVFMN